MSLLVVYQLYDEFYGFNQVHYFQGIEGINLTFQRIHIHNPKYPSKGENINLY